MSPYSQNLACLGACSDEAGQNQPISGQPGTTTDCFDYFTTIETIIFGFGGQ